VARAEVSESRFALGYRPQLDGIRAIAVLAVMAFHADVFFSNEPSLPGGFLGVDVFFALSGFLITTILAEEWARRGGIDLLAFYARRALRLLPAVIVLLAAIVVYAHVVLNDSAAHFLRRQALWTLVYVQNWNIINTRPGVLFHLSHTWSLSIEEQFYLLWPLLLLGILTLRRSARAAIVVVLTAAGASLVAMVVVTRSDPVHAFYGTETRAQTLLFGAALGLAAVFGKLPRSDRRWPAAVGWFGAVALALSFAAVDGITSTDGPITVAGLASVALIFGVLCAPHTLLARALSTRVPVAIGRISYGLYLWHLPVFLVLTPRQTDFTVWNTGLSFWPLLAVRVTATFAVATASFVLVERPCLRLKRRFERRPEQAGTVVLAPGVTVPQ
jgi:peptidoglycan/LPS O-acetylase OafA/YrhL